MKVSNVSDSTVGLDEIAQGAELDDKNFGH